MVAEGVSGEAEEFGGAALVAAGYLEGLTNQIFVEVVEGDTVGGKA